MRTCPNCGYETSNAYLCDGCYMEENPYEYANAEEWWTTCDPGQGNSFFTDGWQSEQEARDALEAMCESGSCLSGAVYPPSGDAVAIMTTTITVTITNH